MVSSSTNMVSSSTNNGSSVFDFPDVTAGEEGVEVDEMTNSLSSSTTEKLSPVRTTSNATRKSRLSSTSDAAIYSDPRFTKKNPKTPLSPSNALKMQLIPTNPEDVIESSRTSTFLLTKVEAVHEQAQAQEDTMDEALENEEAQPQREKMSRGRPLREKAQTPVPAAHVEKEATPKTPGRRGRPPRNRQISDDDITSDITATPLTEPNALKSNLKTIPKAKKVPMEEPPKIPVEASVTLLENEMTPKKPGRRGRPPRKRQVTIDNSTREIAATDNEEEERKSVAATPSAEPNALKSNDVQAQPVPKTELGKKCRSLVVDAGVEWYGQVVWAHMRGFQYWPGFVCDPALLGKKELAAYDPETKHWVYFYGSNNRCAASLHTYIL
jgi:hypothetical protein